MKDVLKNRSLLVLGAAESISNIGNWITIMALYAMVVFGGEGGVLESSGIMLAGLGPMLIFSPVAGWLSDRFDRKWLLIGSQVLAGIPVIAIVLIGDGLVLYGLLALQTICVTVMLPARQAAVPMLVPKDKLTQSNAFLQQLNSFFKIGGPVLGGAIVGLIGARQAMLLDVISFGLAAGVLLLLPSLPPQHDESQDGSTEAPAAGSDGTRSISLTAALRDSGQLRLLFVSTFLAIAVIMGFDVIGAIYVRDVLLAQEGLFGVLIGAVGVGSLLSGGWLMLRRRQRNPWRDLIWGSGLLGVIPLFMAVGYWFDDPKTARWIVGGALLVGGVGNGLTTVQVATLLQVLSPPSLLGRMGGIFQSTIVAGQLITILVTPLLVPAYLSLGLFFAAGAGALLLVLLWLAFSLARVPSVSLSEVGAQTRA